MPLINFTLTEHLIEEKIQAATEKVVGQTHEKIALDAHRRTNELRKYMDHHFQRSQLAMHSMQNDIDSANKNVVM